MKTLFFATTKAGSNLVQAPQPGPYANRVLKSPVCIRSIGKDDALPARYGRMVKACVIISLLFSITIKAQTDSTKGTFWKPKPANYQVKQAIEIESLFPMFLTGGYHFAVGYRYKKFRLRVSVINGGTYNAETAGINNNSANFKRYYTTSPGEFFGYNVWKNLDVYTYLEFHTFRITQRSTGDQKNLKSIDTGIGTSYQFFIGRYFYIQPGLHLYLRASNSVDFGTARYSIPNADVSPVIRVGVRLWKQYL